eukprot:16289-Heterococcus_DN1.PRE.6
MCANITVLENSNYYRLSHSGAAMELLLCYTVQSDVITIAYFNGLSQQQCATLWPFYAATTTITTATATYYTKQVQPLALLADLSALAQSACCSAQQLCVNVFQYLCRLRHLLITVSEGQAQRALSQIAQLIGQVAVAAQH